MNCMKMGLCSIVFCMATTCIPDSSGAAQALFAKEAILDDLRAYDEPTDMAESLSTSGVSVQPTTEYDEIYDLYKDYQRNGQPVFITADILFHTVHKVFDYSLRVIELEQFPLLQKFSEEMFKSSLKLKKEWGKYEHLADPIDQLTAYFAVPNILLENAVGMQGSLEEKVNGEIELIRAHKGFAFSKVLKQKEDYSQYIVRGHYTRNDSLRKYFLGTMWYGRRMFRFDESFPHGAGLPPDTPDLSGWWGKNGSENLPRIAQSEILAGCLLVYLLENTEIEGKHAVDIYKCLKAPFDFLVGQSEDITIEILSDALNKTFGRNWKPADLKNNGKLYAMAESLAKGNVVKIDSTGMGRKGLTLLGQRFILDSAFFQKLVNAKENPLPYTKKGSKGKKPFTWMTDPTFGEIRGFPRGLDIMAVLGSETAEDMLTNQGDADYKNYAGNLNSLKEDFKNLRPSENIYEKMLHSFVPLFHTDKNAPLFMQSEMWKKKSLNTALGAWTELRHDTILYGKQSYTPVTRGGFSRPRTQDAYVEPNPEAYRRLSSILSALRDSEAIVFPEYLLRKYRSLSAILDKLADISEKELRGAMPDREETGFLGILSDRLKHEAKLPYDIAESVTGEADSQMALVADVHTCMPEALTEAVGFPAKIIVVIPVRNKPRLFFGGAYSYYEFKVPYENRLTDEKWIEELSTGKSRHKPVFFQGQ